jgi:hypothetical protein
MKFHVLSLFSGRLCSFFPIAVFFAEKKRVLQKKEVHQESSSKIKQRFTITP